MNNQETTFQFAGKEVTFTRDGWRYGVFSESEVRALNPEVATKINQLVAAERIKIRQEQRKFLVTKFDAFKHEVKKLVTPEYTVVFLADSRDEKDLVFGDIQQATVSKDYKNTELHFQIEYNDRAYRSGDWSSHKANNPWTIRYDYKTIRYGTLEKLVTKGLERLKEAEETIDRNRADAEKKTQKIALMQEELGYSVDKTAEYSSGTCRSYERIAVQTANDFRVFIDRNDDGIYSIEKIKSPYMGFRKLSVKQVKAILLALSQLSKGD